MQRWETTQQVHHCFGTNLLLLLVVCLSRSTMCLSNFHILFILQASETLHDVALSIVYYSLMLGGRTNTNLFCSPLPANEMFPRTISVEQDITTGRHDQERERAKEKKLAVLSLASFSLSHMYTHRLFTAARIISVWCIEWQEKRMYAWQGQINRSSLREHDRCSVEIEVKMVLVSERFIQWLHVSSIFYTRWEQKKDVSSLFTVYPCRVFEQTRRKKTEENKEINSENLYKKNEEKLVVVMKKKKRHEHTYTPDATK